MEERIEWRARLARAIIDGLRPDIDQEIIITQIMAGMNQAHYEGLDDAAYVCRKVADAEMAPAHVKKTAALLANAIENLKGLNRKGDESSLHTW